MEDVENKGPTNNGFLDRALKKRFALLEKTRIHRIAEKCFQSDIPPVRERRIVAKGLKNAERDISIIPEKADIAKVTYHPIDPGVIQDYKNWLEDRKKLREELDQLGNYTSWIRGKRNPTALEGRVLRADVAKEQALYSDLTDSLPSTPQVMDSSLGGSEAERPHSTVLTPPPVTDAIRILHDYVDSRKLRLHDLFTQLDKNKSWTLEKSELSKLGLSYTQIEELLGPLERLSYKDVLLASRALKAEQRLVKKCLKPALPPIRSTDQLLCTPELDAVGDMYEAPLSPSQESRYNSFSPLEWAQYSHRQVPSLGSNLRDRILNFRDETWNEYQNLVVKCKQEGVTLSVLTLARGLLAPGDRRWEECTKHLRQITGVEIIKQQKPETGKGKQDSNLSSTSADKLQVKVSKYYDTTLQYRDIARKNPGERVKLSTGAAVVRPRTDCWMTYEEYLALTAKVRTKFRWEFGRQEPWCGHLLDKLRLCMPEPPARPTDALFSVTCSSRGSARRRTGLTVNEAGYHQTSTRVRQSLL